MSPSPSGRCARRRARGPRTGWCRCRRRWWAAVPGGVPVGRRRGAGSGGIPPPPGLSAVRTCSTAGVDSREVCAASGRSVGGVPAWCRLSALIMRFRAPTTGESDRCRCGAAGCARGADGWRCTRCGRLLRVPPPAGAGPPDRAGPRAERRAGPSSGAAGVKNRGPAPAGRLSPGPCAVRYAVRSPGAVGTCAVWGWLTGWAPPLVALCGGGFGCAAPLS